MTAASTPPDTQSSYRYLRHRLSEPDQFAAAVSGAELRADFLGMPEGATFVEQFQTPDRALDFYDARVRARIFGASPPGWGSIALMRDRMPSRWYGTSSQRGLLVFTPPGEVIDGCILPGFQGIALHVSPAIWERCRQLGLHDAEEVLPHRHRVGSVSTLPAHFFDEIDARLLSLRKLLSKVDQPGGNAAASAVIANQLVDELVTIAWEQQDGKGTASGRERQGPVNRARLARRAEEWLRDHLHEPVSIPDLCLALRVSRREIEYAFRQAFDQSPRSFLQALRLNAIHKALRRVPPDRGEVTRIALEHGITHLGRFSAQYRELFGELPRCSLADEIPISDGLVAHF